jgi:hypothetical protein
VELFLQDKNVSEPQKMPKMSELILWCTAANFAKEEK